MRPPTDPVCDLLEFRVKDLTLSWPEVGQMLFDFLQTDVCVTSRDKLHRAFPHFCVRIAEPLHRQVHCGLKLNAVPRIRLDAHLRSKARENLQTRRVHPVMHVFFLRRSQQELRGELRAHRLAPREIQQSILDGFLYSTDWRLPAVQPKEEAKDPMQIGPLAGARDLVLRDAGKSSAEDLRLRDTPAHSCLGSCVGGSWQSHATTHLDLSHCERRPARQERTSGALSRASSRIWSTRNASRSPQTAPARVPPPERNWKTTGPADPDPRHWEHHEADGLTGQTFDVYRLWKAPRLAAFLHLDWQQLKAPRENWSRTPVAVCRAAREQVPPPLGPCRQRSARHPDHWMRCFPGCVPRSLFPIYSEKKDAYQLPRCHHLVPHLKAHTNLAGELTDAHALDPCSHHGRLGQA